MAEYLEGLRQDTFTAAGNGTTQSVVNKSFKHFALQVKGTGSAAAGWSVALEGSLDNSNFTTILTHSTATGDGVIIWSGADSYPVLHFRARVASLTLGSATDIVTSILAYD